MVRDMLYESLPVTFQFTCIATELSVRNVMVQIHRALADHAVSGDLLSSVEIAVAEGLNNIVEHACANQPDGKILVEMRVNAAHIFVQLQDPGLPLPGWTLPEGRAADVSVARDALPEGGFGWNLIHTLTDRLAYSRSTNMNHLKMWFVQRETP